MFKDKEKDADQLTSDDDDESDEGGEGDDDDEINEKQTLPGYMLCPQLQTTDAMGLWEEHTKVGQELFERMIESQIIDPLLQSA